MVKFSIMNEDGKVTVKNMETDKTYSTSDDSMQRIWDHFSPGVHYMDSDMYKREKIYVADLDPAFEVAVKNNPYIGGYRHKKRSHKKRSHKKRSNKKRSHKKRTTRRR
jgi:hypothetical protein